MENLPTLQKDYCKIYNYLVNAACGTTRGQLILWKNSLYELAYSIETRSSITVVLKITGITETICVTNIYIPHRAEDRIQMLSSVMRILESIPHLFKIIGGDFNMILNLWEKKGGLRKLDRDAKAFQETINKMELVDMQSANGTYTWNNRRGRDR